MLSIVGDPPDSTTYQWVLRLGPSSMMGHSMPQISILKAAHLTSCYMLSRVSFWCCLAASLSLSLANGKNPKRGLGFSAMPDDIINANQSASVVSWQYNWAILPPAYLATSNIEYIPMQWGSSGIQAFSDNVQAQEAHTILVRPQFFPVIY